MIITRDVIHGFIFICLLILTLPFSTSAENVPRGIAGINLGTNVKDYPNIIQSNVLKDVVVTDWHGFRKGIISYGTCKYVDQILKIDMKYQNKSNKFFQQLFKEFSEKFGEPDSWHGDSFGVMHIWKWKFLDQQKNRVSLVLQYNGKNSNETIGNVVKLSYPEKIKEERFCFVEMCDAGKAGDAPKSKEHQQDSDWSYLVPN